MSSGEKQIVINTRERAIGTDINRLQSFIARDRSQLVRSQYNDARQDPLKYPGVAVPFTGSETPLVGDVFGGLMVDPLTTSVLVQPGVLGCLFPDPGATADDSPYLLVDDPGLQTAGVLAFTANASGQIRVDLVECQPVSTILETDNRDIFDPGTGLFVPAAVTKVKTFRLQYRIRVGTGGAGVPALAVGWLPLAAIVMPSGAADYTTCEFYDVRPLVEERTNPHPLAAFVNQQYAPLQDASFFSQVATGTTFLSGYSETQFSGYRAGGWLRKSSPTFLGTFAGTSYDDGDPDSFSCTNVENRVTGFAPAAGAFIYLTAFFPGGLPRWVRYSHSAVGGGLGRVPKGPRGVLLLTTHAPQANGVMDSLAIGGGLGNAPGVAIGVLLYNQAGTDFVGVVANKGSHEMAAWPIINFVTATSATVIQWGLTSGVLVPTNATEACVELRFATINSSTIECASIKVEIFAFSPGGVGYLAQLLEQIVIPAGSTTVCKRFIVPLIGRDGPLSTSGPSTYVKITLTASTSTFSTSASAHAIQPHAWKLQ